MATILPSSSLDEDRVFIRQIQLLVHAGNDWKLVKFVHFENVTRE